MSDNSNNKEQANPGFGPGCGQVFTLATMVSFLLQSGYTVDQIEGRVAGPDGFVQACLSDSDPIEENPSGETSRLKDFYLREQVKALLRYHPYLGINRGSERLGISRAEYEFTYSALIKSGEVRFVMDTPTWGEAGSKKLPLRKHIVN